MTYLVIALVVLGIVAALTNIGQRGNDEPRAATKAQTCDTCTGSDSQCEQLCMMEAATRPIEYYDDEELDRYQGRGSNSYTDEEVAEFADILYTMQPSDVAGWSRSLTLRHIQLPDQLRDEVIMMIQS